MATRRKAFFSFHYRPDNWRAAQVRNMGVVEGNASVSDNDWETIKRGGNAAIRRWIDRQLKGKSCAIVLIGSKTAGRKWINYEIETAWNEGKGLLGIYVHNLKDRKGAQSAKGGNPFSSFTVGDRRLSGIVKAHSPPYSGSRNVYSHIEANISEWVEEAIQIRKEYS